MPSARARATCCLALALLAVSCVEVNIRRTIEPDGSGRQTITMRVSKAPSPQAAELFPGAFSGATAMPLSKRATPDGTTHTADIVFSNIGQLRHQAAFLHSSASFKPAPDGTLHYRETLANGYLNSLRRAPDPARKRTLAAAIAKARSDLANARLTYTVCFPAKVVKSNADRVRGSEATWVLTPDKLFAGPTLELTADCRTQPAVASAPPSRPARPARLAPRPADPGPRPEPRTLAAPAARGAVLAPVLAPRQTPPADRPLPTLLAAPTRKPAATLDRTLLAQASDAEPRPAAARPAAALPKPKPKATTLDDEASDDESTKQVKGLFRQALVQLDRKEYEKAAQLLQQAIALKPDSVVVADLYRIAVAKFIDAAHESKNAELKAHAEKLQQIAFKGRMEQLRTPAYVEGLVDSLSKGFLPRTFAMEELILAGDYAVPHLIRYMQKTPNPEVRAYAGYVLSRLGAIAVPAICEALKCPDPIIRQIVIQALETIGDRRAIPALLATAQEPKGHPLVVESARKAAAKIANDANVTQTHAPIAFLALAEDYYERNRKVLLPHLYEHLVWRWDPDSKQLTSESVPEPLYPYRMAEEACRNAILAEPSFEPAIPLIVCTYFAQQEFLEQFFLSIQGKKLTPALAKEAELAKPIRQRLKAAPLVAHAAGSTFVYAALRRSLRDGRTGVAVRCIHALREIADGAELPEPPLPEDEVRKIEKQARARTRRPRLVTWFGAKPEDKPQAPGPPVNPYAIQLDGSPLIEALGYTPHRCVRYAAAEAIVAINPHQMILDADKVMTNLSLALAESADRVALLVDDDETRADRIRGLLRDAAIMPVLARTQRDALKRATELPPKDFLILNGQMKETDVAEVLASLRRVTYLATAPTLIVTARPDLPKLRTRLAKENVVFLSTPFDRQSVANAVDALLKKAPDPRQKDTAVAYSASAAATLASIDPATSIFKLSDALPALLGAVASRSHPDDVRVPAAQAIEHAAAPTAVPYLVNVYNDAKSSKALRLAVLGAVGACSASQKTLAPEAAAVLADAASHADFDYRQAAARAFGLRGGAASTEVLDVIDQLHGKKPKAAK